MIGMAIRPPWTDAEVIRSENAAQQLCQAVNLFRHGAVRKPKLKHTDGSATQPVEGNPPLKGARRRQIASQTTRSGMRRFTIGHSNHHRFNAGALHMLDEASGAEDFVIRMRSHHNQATRPTFDQRTELRKTTRPEPELLARTRVPLVND